MRVILGVVQGKRPTRPYDRLSWMRGLANDVWDLVEACWSRSPELRPTATQVAERVRAVPNHLVDKRPLDDYNNSLAQALRKNTDHPFSVLTKQSPAVS
jgi:hypothetical protein